MTVKVPKSLVTEASSLISQYSIGDVRKISTGTSITFTFDVQDENVFQHRLVNWLLDNFNGTVKSHARQLTKRHTTIIDKLLSEVKTLTDEVELLSAQVREKDDYIKQLMDKVAVQKLRMIELESYSGLVQKVDSIKTKAEKRWPGKKTSKIFDFINQELQK